MVIIFMKCDLIYLNTEMIFIADEFSSGDERVGV